jgi:uncharacterized protein YdeI (YjbR/CyaY-like superfamily)
MPKMVAPEPSDFYPESRPAWREWLAQNGATCTGVWLVYRKKGSEGGANLSYDDAVEEALCYGWIDSRVKPINETHWKQWFCPRKPKSVWSKVNKARIEKLQAAGLITPPGQAVIDVAIANGSWTSIDDVEEGKVCPDLQAALNANPQAKTNFEAFAFSARKALVQWVQSAKTNTTRAKRIAEIVSLAQQNIKANTPQSRTKPSL